MAKKPLYMEYRGVKVYVSERRKYGPKATFTWLMFVDNKGETKVAAPWRAVMPAKKEVRKQTDHYISTGELHGGPHVD